MDAGGRATKVQIPASSFHSMHSKPRPLPPSLRPKRQLTNLRQYLHLEKYVRTSDYEIAMSCILFQMHALCRAWEDGWMMAGKLTE